MDNDCIVRGNLVSIYDGVEADMVKFWHKPKKHKKYQFQGGVYVIGSGTRVQNWLSSIIVELSNRNDWLAPQEVMIDRLQALCIDTVPLGIRYNDSTFKKGSIVWHCKHGHFEEPAYQKEYQQYLRLSCEKKN